MNGTTVLHNNISGSTIYIKNERTDSLQTECNWFDAPALPDASMIEGGVIVPTYLMDSINTVDVGFVPTLACRDPLAVEFVEFSAQNIDCNVQLIWSTAFEDEHVVYYIERSRNGQEFVAIAEVAANGTSSVETRYTFVDDQVEDGLSFYRIQQKDLYGTITYSEVQKVNLNCQLSNEISLFPNPTHQFIYLKGLKAGQVVKVLDILGKELLSEEITQVENRMDVSRLKGGMYFVIVLEEGAQVFQTKMLKKD